ncbi:MAG: LppM family (lipo)protein [candidate division WOR-3 bacterium]
MKRIAILAVVAVAIGCFSIEIKSEIGPDGKGTQTMVLYGLKENEPFFGGMADSLAKEIGTEAKRTQKGDTVYFTIEKKGHDFTKANEGQKPLVTKEGDKWVFEMTSEGSGQEGETTKGAFEGYTFKLTVTLPGKILTHNATKKSGNTLTWEMPMYEFQVKGLTARAEYQPAKGGFCCSCAKK